jgi:hypothetical protein
MRRNEIPPLDWWLAQNAKLKPRWDATPWQAGGVTALKPLTQEIRRLAPIINQLPGNFMAMTADQHLAVLREGYRYECFSVTDDLGDGRLACRSIDSKEFALYSPGTRKNLAEGVKIFFTALAPFDSSESGIECYATYGPILCWNGLRLTDIECLARYVARDLYAAQGFSAVARRNPVPFWASYRWGTAPTVFHEEDLLCSCQATGRLCAGFESRLSEGWERTDAGKKSRFTFKAEKSFHDQYVYYDRKTDRALLYSSLEPDFESLIEILGDSFIPDSQGSERISFLMETILREVLGKELEYSSWAKPFESKERKTSPENSSFSRIEKAMPDIIEAINARKEPDWIRIGERYGFSAEDMQNLKELASGIAEKLK